MDSKHIDATPLDVLHFPSDFYFGVATAAHQVEGNNHLSDWWDFETTPGAIADGSRSGLACDHFRRYEQDLDLITQLRSNSYRFSLEWARIEPEPGRFDTSSIQHYRDVLLACHQRGIKPWVTLYHFTLPQWFSRAGGWLNPESPQRFARYVDAVLPSLADHVVGWITINEPVVYLYHSYLLGRWPPRRNNPREMIIAGRNLLRAHMNAYRILHQRAGFRGNPARVGIAKHLRVFDPARDSNRFDRWMAKFQDGSFNWSFLDSIHRARFMPPFGVGEPIPHATPAQDFLGVNYYSRGRVRFSPASPGQLFAIQETTAQAPTNDLGWEIYPEGILRLLRIAWRRYALPVVITENGIADAEDKKRSAFIIHHLAKISAALLEGIPVEGYFHWSLFDNFEWAEGFSARFGLFALDYTNQTRTLRPSGTLFRDIAVQKHIPARWLTQYSISP